MQGSGFPTSIAELSDKLLTGLLPSTQEVSSDIKHNKSFDKRYQVWWEPLFGSHEMDRKVYL